MGLVEAVPVDVLDPDPRSLVPEGAAPIVTVTEELAAPLPGDVDGAAIAELKKVAWPTRQETVAYSIVVLVSVVVIVWQSNETFFIPTQKDMVQSEKALADQQQMIVMPCRIIGTFSTATCFPRVSIQKRVVEP